MNPCEPGIPDLLRRFVPTPYQSDICCRGIRLAVQTNDLDILSELEQKTDTNGNDASESPLLMKIIRDHAAPAELSDPVAVSCGPVAILMVGAGTVLFVDAERKEILGFLAPSITQRHFVDELLPVILKLFHDATCQSDSTLALESP